jgi:hypothetical protein
MIIDESKFGSKKELFNFLIANKETLIAQKKAEKKLADICTTSSLLFDSKGEVLKANEPFIPDSDKFKTRVIINTTNLYDSHRDVHLKGIWNKTLKENRNMMHLQEHESRKFSHIISDGPDLEAFVKTYTWSELGYPEYKGNTEGLTFDSLIRQKRNEFMFDQYSNGWVKMHSVGMYYIKMILGINDDSYGAEFEAWEKYSTEIVNLDDAEKFGYAWFIKEAKAIEGSAVPNGSNFATPTLDNNMKFEPFTNTHKEPLSDTPVDYNKLAENYKSFN